MNRDDIIRMAREAGLYEDGKFFVLEHGELTRFAAIVAAAFEKRSSAASKARCACRGAGFIKLAMQAERENGAAAEREACADICDQHASVEGIAQRCAEQIRARGKT